MESSILWVFIVSIVTSVAAIITALVALASVSVAKKSLFLTIIDEVLKEYGKSEMKENMHILVGWFHSNCIRNNWKEEFRRFRVRTDKDSKTEEIRQVDNARREFIHLALRIYRLFRMKVVRKRLAREIVSVSYVSFLVCIIRHFEEAISDTFNEDHRNMLRFFESLYSRREIIMEHNRLHGRIQGLPCCQFEDVKKRDLRSTVKRIELFLGIRLCD